MRREHDFMIVAEGLTKKYKEFISLDDLNLQVSRGEIFGFLGHNGAGKTTTVNILTTLLSPTSGRASICGFDIQDESRQVRERIGYLPENVKFYEDLTAFENLAFFARLSGVKNPGEKISEVLTFLDFQGIENKKLGEFSKGMRQRIGIAQAIIHDPEVLFLDEPTSGLDPMGIKHLREVILRLNSEKGMTIFMNTHLLSEVARTCTTIGVLSHGRLIYGKVPDTSTPPFFPLKMLRGVVDYLEIIGAILGIILGYLSIAKEKGKNTLQLLLSRPIGQYDIVSGKVLGNSALILSVLAVNALALYLILWFVGGVQFSTAELVKLGLVFVASYFYIMFFFCLTSILALKLKSLPNALIIGFTIWLAFVLIIPQIGDTMDPDNQIPGGFFKSMKMNHDQGKEILKKFKTYETVRNTIEETSITKHYERLSFALLGIKDYYNNKTLGFIFHDKWFDGVWVAGFFLLALLAEYLVLARKEHILHNG